MDIAANIATIRARITEACQKCQRDPDSVRLVAVSKVKPAEMINAAFAAGQSCFGESYVQEFQEKAPQVNVPVEWHFIGHLQSNKVKYLGDKVALIHSVDRLSLAKEINRQADKLDRKAAILIQVNLGEEESKSWATEAELEVLVRQVAALENLEIKGLMALPPWCEDPEEVRPYFWKLREMTQQIDQLRIPGVDMTELSMGMSHDFPVAIEEGATLVRVGTAIFGERYR